MTQNILQIASAKAQISSGRKCIKESIWRRNMCIPFRSLNAFSLFYQNKSATIARTSSIDTMLSRALFVGLALLAVSGADAYYSECPKDALRNGTVQIPHEYECTKYYTCLGSKNKVLRECPLMDGEGNRLHFNAKLQVCDWPWAAECDSRPISIKAMKKILFDIKPIPTSCPKVDSKYETVHLADKNDCTKFYKCLQGRKIPMSCPEDQEGNKLYFNPSEQVCDWPYNVDCQQPQFSLRMLLAAKPRATTCPKVDSVDETVLLAHERDCTKFYACSNGRKIVQQCPKLDEEGNRLYFNPEEQICDWPWNVDCKLPEPLLRAVPVKNITPVPTECPEKDPLEYEVNIAHESDCTQFYKCYRGIKYLQQCPKIEGTQNRLFFNKYQQECDLPWKAACDLGKPLFKFLKH